MKTLHDLLPPLLFAAAIGQLAIAVINMSLDRLLHWKAELAGISRLLREVFQVHKWFISITLAIFGVLTLRFSSEIGTGASELARWLAAGIGFFWLFRTVIQWTYYSRDHWIGKRKETLIHWILTVAYGGCGLVYLAAAFLPG